MIKIDSNNILDKVSIGDLSVIVITHKRIALLGLMLTSLQTALEAGSFVPEIIFCVNGPDPESVEFLEQSRNTLRFKFRILSLDNAVTPAEARNIASMQESADWLIFLDDDVEIPPDFFANFRLLASADPGVALWGGPNLTPLQSNLVQKKIGWYLGHYLVTGPISQRYKLNRFRELECRGIYFSLCNMFVKTEFFKKIQFNTKLKTAEENELVFRFSQKNFRMKASDLLYVWHSRRPSMTHFLNQIQNYGYGRGQLIANGAVSTLLPLMLITGVVAALAFLAWQPFLSIAGALIWLVFIYASLLQNFGFKDQNLTEFFLPAQILFRYSAGLIKGYFATSQMSKRLQATLQK